MIVKQVALSDILITNAYFYIDETTNHGFLIDPAAEAEKLLEIIRKNNWVIEKILLTHGHFDHIGAVETIHQALNIPYFAHPKGGKYLTDSKMNLSAYFNHPITLNNVKYLDDNIMLSSNHNVKLAVIYTPGHTEDSVIYYDAAEHIAFVGDTIFKNSIGATHFPGGSLTQLQQSIQQKIFTLPDDTVLYSGHSEPTTVGAEKKNFIKYTEF